VFLTVVDILLSERRSEGMMKMHSIHGYHCRPKMLAFGWSQGRRGKFPRSQYFHGPPPIVISAATKNTSASEAHFMMGRGIPGSD